LKPVSAALLTCVLAATSASAQAPAPDPAAKKAPPYAFSGLVFGDYYYNSQYHDPAWEGAQGFRLRRIYFTFDYTFSPAISTRFRIEANSPAEAGDDSLTPYVKDAYLRWTFFRQHAVTLGIQPTLSFNYVESVWGLRHIEKTPVDLYQWDSSRDTGITVGGAVGTRRAVTWNLQFGNDRGSDADPDTYTALRAAIRLEPLKNLSVEAAGTRLSREPDARRSTGQIFVGYRGERARAGFHYSWQAQRPDAASGRPDRDVSLYSGFVVADVKPRKLSAFARIDRHDDPLLDGASIDYLPIDPSAAFTLTIVGAEYYLIPSVRFSPNVEWVSYSAPADPALAKPKNDIVWRATFYWAW
jgi:hypothetical protein